MNINLTLSEARAALIALKEIRLQLDLCKEREWNIDLALRSNEVSRNAIDTAADQVCRAIIDFHELEAERQNRIKEATR